ncbi:MAG: TolC family protein [Acidobacteria bacterium]|nr:TolC family protein [Acidobacteriota bacterium]
MIQDGKIALSLPQLISAVLDNNLDISVARFPMALAETDLLRANGGQAPRGFEGAPVPAGLFAGAIGAGIGQVNFATAALGGIGNAGGLSASSRGLSLNPRGALDPTVIIHYSFNHVSSPLNSLRISGVPVVTSSTPFWQVSYQQAFTTGTTFSLGYSSQIQRSTQQSLLFNPAVATRYTFTFTQNLLSGFGSAVNHRFQDVAATNRQISDEIFRQRVIGVVTQAQNVYWDLVAARENLRNAEQALAVAQRLADDNRRRVEIGTMAAVGLIPAEAELARRQRDRVTAETRLQTTELALKNLLSRQVDRALAEARLEATAALPEPTSTEIPDYEQALKLAMENRPELRQAAMNISKQDVVVRFAKDSLRPTLILFGQLASVGFAGNRFVPNPAGGPPLQVTRGAAQAFSQLARLDFPEYAIGFSFTVPIKNRAAQADSMRAQMDRQSAEVAAQRTRLQIGLEVRQALIGLAQNKARVEASRKALNLSEQAADAEEKKFRAGISTPYDVIRLQRDLIAAQRAEVEARVNFAKALVEMARATGTTLEKASVDWEKIHGR